MPKIFLLKFYETSVKDAFFKLLLFSLFSKLCKTSADDCFLVYSSNFVRLTLTTTFELT